jgi:glycosyltransferase involved in cell wall biosynthesis
LKYWLLTTEYPPQFGGGIGSYCYQWSSILDQNGVELTVFVLNKAEKNFKESVRDNIRVIEFSPYLKDTSDFLGYETMVSSSFDEIVRLYLEREGSPDWIEAQEYQGIAYFILQKKHLGEPLYKNLKILITCHCPSFITFEHNHISSYQLPYFWIAEMERFCMKAADICIFPSRYLANDILQRHPGLIENYCILRNPYFVKGKSEDDHSPEKCDFIVIGKLSPAKGILTTLAVFEKLWKKGYGYKLKLIGDENYFHHAAGITTGDLIRKKYSSWLNAGLLVMTGMLEPAKIKKEIHQADIILVPSSVENLPYTVIETMAAGKVVVASSQGGQRELINDRDNGFLFDYNSLASFEEKIQIAKNLGKDEIDKIKKNAVETIRSKCDPTIYFKRKMELLNEHSMHERNNFPFIASYGKEKLHTVYDQNNELLSIVIPYFNMGKYINDTIASIDQSDYIKKEIIIVNDGSSDEESIRALNAFASRGDVKIIHQENLGLPAARNNGVLAAKGKYLAFLDADDRVAKNYFQKAIGILQQKANVHFVGCWIQYFDGSAGKWPSFTPEPPFLLYHNMINSSSLVYLKENFLKSGLNDSQFIYGMEDYDSLISLIKNGYNGVAIPEFLFYYRVRKDSMARKFNKSNKLFLYQLLSGKHKQFYATFAPELFGLLNANGPGIFLDNPTLDYHLAEKIPFAGNMSKKLIRLVKRNRITRKMAYKIYRLINH